MSLFPDAFLNALGVIGSCVALAALLPIFTLISGLRFPRRLVVGVAVFTLGALLFGELANGYETFPWWDMALHVGSAAVLSVAGMGLALLPTAGAAPRTGIWVLAVLAFGFSMMVGAMWELMEFTLDQTFGTNTQDSGLIDTMTDIVANLVGAVFGAVASHLAVTRGTRVPPAALLLDFLDANPVIYGGWDGPLGDGPRRDAGGGDP